MSPKKFSSSDKPDTIDSGEVDEAQRVEQDTQSAEIASEPQGSRRVTRSQTGRVAKRPLADEAAPEPKKRAATSTKRTKRPSRPNSSEEETPAEETSPAQPPLSEPPTPAASSNTTPVPENESMGPQQHSRITFLEVSTVTGESGERRMSRTRAFFPTPVPNLTKKSRGRRVPTTETVDPATQPDKRYYVCKVENCGKCFHRGEHLKRHIRSIHTHEKPFKCTYPQCEKFFNRHDNLLQHLKVHKEAKATRGTKSGSQSSRPSTPPSMSALGQEIESPGASDGAPDSPNIPARPRTIYDHQPGLYSGYANTGPFEGSAEPIRFVTNMAVSSLRTELPQSPTDARPPPGYPWHRTDYPTDQPLTY